MTVRVTTLKGPDAGRYYVDELPRYYLEAGEPPGRWMGRGAASSGLVGEVGDGEAFVAVLAGLDPSGRLARGRRYGEDSARGYDVTCSAPKSVSVLWAVADDVTRAEVVAAHDAAVAAVFGFVEDQATTRPCFGRRVVVVDTEGLTAAAFRQHTSRALDPQLHTHLVVAAKVQALDGRWLALDARMLKCDQRTLSAIYHASLRAELTRRLGVRWRPPAGGIAELATIDPGVLDRFSKRTHQYERRLETKLERFEQTMGRLPTPRERYQLGREAVTDSRPAKPKGADAAQLHASWRAELEAARIRPAELVASTVVTAPRARPTQPVVTAMVDQALAALAERQSTWRRNDLVRELARAVPTTLPVAPRQLVGWLGEVADHVIAHQLVEFAPEPPPGVPTRRDGRPITESTLDRHFTTRAVLAQERDIVERVERRRVAPGMPLAVDPAGLDLAQRAVAQAVAGTQKFVAVVGPAGTGKTTALRPAVEALRRRRVDVYGVAPSATAAAVLAAETGMAADTLDKLLHDHRTGRRHPLDPGTTVVVDEAGMVPTPKLAELLELADTHHWRLVLVGDPLQLSAVGRGGMFAHLADTGPALTLEQVHRFASPWERQASLALRTGDTDALAPYDRHGRLHGGTRTDLDHQLVEQWNKLRPTGAVAVLCATNAAAAHLNRRIQAERASAGELELQTRRQLAASQTVHVGDIVATRRNDRTITTSTGAMVKNRQQWTVTAIYPDGSIELSNSEGRLQLPAAYTDRHIELAYAETVHAAQGRTVDHALVLVDGAADAAAVYVGLTRGRSSNHAYVPTESHERAKDKLEELLTLAWGDRPAIELALDRERQGRARRSHGLDTLL